MEGRTGYLGSRGYRRLNVSVGRRRKLQVVVLGSIRRLKPKVLLSPRKLLVGLRDAYVDMMLNIAERRMVGSTLGGDLVSRFGMRMAKEYNDDRMIFVSKSSMRAHR